MSNKKTIKRAMALALASTTLFAGALSAHAEKLKYNTGKLTTDGDNPNVKTIEEIANEVNGKIVILSTNDTHGAVQDFAYVAGLKNYFSKSTKEGGLGASDVILVDSGDFGENKSEKDGIPGPLNKNKKVDAPTDKGVGHYANDHSSYNPIGKIMKAAGYDYVTWGNHEFIDGRKAMDDYVKGTGYVKQDEDNETKGLTIINSNVMETPKNKNEKPEHAFTDYAIRECNNGIKIGFFGLDTSEIENNTAGYTIEDIAASAEKAVSNLKNPNNNADIIICLSHLGLEDRYSAYEKTKDKKDEYIQYLINSNGDDIEKVENKDELITPYDITGDKGIRSADIWARTKYDGDPGIDLMLDGHSHTAINSGDGVNTAPIMSTEIWCRYVGVTILGKNSDGNAVIEHRYLIPDYDFEKVKFADPEQFGSKATNDLINDKIYGENGENGESVEKFAESAEQRHSKETEDEKVVAYSKKFYVENRKEAIDYLGKVIDEYKNADKKPGDTKTPGKNSGKNNGKNNDKNDKNGKNNKNNKGNNKFNKREWNEEDLEYGVTEETEVTSSEASTETSVTEDAQITDEAKDQNSTQAATNASDEASAQDSAETDVQENSDTEVEPAA